MKYKVKSKLDHNSRIKRKQDWLKLTAYEQRVANILQHKTVQHGKVEIPVRIKEDSSEQYIHDDTNFELEGTDEHSPTGKDYINGYEKSLSPSLYQPIENTDTQEVSQMRIANSLQVISQQNREILYFIRKTYDLKVDDSKKRQAYQTIKLALYRRKLEIMQTHLEMDKLAYS